MGYLWLLTNVPNFIAPLEHGGAGGHGVRVRKGSASEGGSGRGEPGLVVFEIIWTGGVIFCDLKM